MKRIGLALLAILLAAGVSSGLELYYEKVSASQTNSTVSITLTATGNKAVQALIANDGPNEIYVDVGGDGVATTANAEIPAGKEYSFTMPGNQSIDAIGIICDTDETATVRVYASPR